MGVEKRILKGRCVQTSTASIPLAVTTETAIYNWRESMSISTRPPEVSLRHLDMYFSVRANQARRPHQPKDCIE